MPGTTQTLAAVPSVMVQTGAGPTTATANLKRPGATAGGGAVPTRVPMQGPGSGLLGVVVPASSAAGPHAGAPPAKKLKMDVGKGAGGDKGAGEEAAGGKENAEEVNDVLAMAGVNPEHEVDAQDDIHDGSCVPRRRNRTPLQQRMGCNIQRAPDNMMQHATCTGQRDRAVLR
jgi:hypothetical protein